MKGFVPLRVRWVVERTFAWLGRSRTLAKDWERKIENSISWMLVASISFKGLYQRAHKLILFWDAKLFHSGSNSGTPWHLKKGLAHVLVGIMHIVQMVLNFDKMSRQINHDLQNADGV